MLEWVAAGCTARLVNLYGTTECSAWAFAAEYPLDAAALRALSWEGRLAIGTALDATDWEVRNGELWIGGNARRCWVGSPLDDPPRLPCTNKGRECPYFGADRCRGQCGPGFQAAADRGPCACP